MYIICICIYVCIDLHIHTLHVKFMFTLRAWETSGWHIIPAMTACDVKDPRGSMGPWYIYLPTFLS